jgi:adenine-specific DNA-methyltransferase
MNLTIVPFKKTLNKAYQKVKPNRAEIEQFKANLSRLLDRIDHEESEENAKKPFAGFSERYLVQRLAPCEYERSYRPRHPRR